MASEPRYALKLIGITAAAAAAVIIACETDIPPVGPVDSVSQLVVSPHTVTLQPGEVQAFMAVGFTAAGDTAQINVTWSVTGGSLVDTSSAGGRHYGDYEGTSCGGFKVAATSHPGEKSDTASVAVVCPPPAVASVDVTPPSASVQAGQTVQLTATPKDANGAPLSGRTVTWSSSNTSVATVSNSGLVSGVTPGSATITATSEGKSGTSTITVTPVPVASVEVTPATPSVQAGQTVQLTATPKDANGAPLSGRTVTWSSSNTAVATVSNGGLVSGVTPGTATITATSEGKSGTSSVTVTKVAVATVEVTPPSASVQAGQTVQLTATPKDAGGTPLSGRTVTWSSSNTAVATVSNSGLVSGVTPGTATITATSEGKSGTSSITVTNVPVATVEVTPPSASVQAGQTVQLTATPRDADGAPLSGRTVTWSSSNTAVATVSNSGLVSAVTPGSATITAASEGKSGTSTITVTPVPVASVDVTPPSASVQAGQTVQLTATPKDAGGASLSGRTVTWSSSNTAVATVSNSGLVSGVTPGSATITATSEGKSGTSSISVTNVPVATVDVTPPSASVQAGQTVQLTGTPRDAGGNPLSGRTVTWSSSNTAVATVSNSGLVSGVTPGSATITATSEGKSGTSSVTVTNVPVASVDATPPSASVQAGQALQLTGTPKDAGGNQLSGRTVTWSSSNTAVATVSNRGLVSGVTPGSATITATSEGKSGTSTVTVTPVPVASVDVTPPSASVQAGQALQLTGTPKDAGGNQLSGRTVTWSSSNTAVATVSNSGLVSGVTPGSATISATSEGKSW